MANVIKQVVENPGVQTIRMSVQDPGEDTQTITINGCSQESQTIKITVQSNERGPVGPKGDPGEAATIEAGSAYTVNYGMNPSVINTGTPSAATFDFYIPEGKPGVDGAPGAPGAPGRDGRDGRDGVDGKDGAIQYTAGNGITISPTNVISATGAAVATWGDIVGDIDDQTDLKNALDSKQNTLTAGANISIDANNEISATNTTYTAGTNVSISSANVISATDTKYTAGTNITISPENVISAAGSAYTAGTGLELNGTVFSVDTDVIAQKTDIPTVNNATLTINQDGTQVATFTANSNTNTTASIVSPVQVGSVLSEPTSVAYVDTANIVDSAVTASKIDFSTFPKYTLSGTTDGSGFVFVPDTVVTPLNGFIIGARGVGQDVNMFTSIYTQIGANTRYGIRCDNYAWQAQANTAVTVEIIYLPL